MHMPETGCELTEIEVELYPMQNFVIKDNTDIVSYMLLKDLELVLFALRW